MFALRRAAWAGARAVGAAASRATPAVSATSSSSLWVARAGVVRATAAASSAGVANFSTKKAPGGADIIDGKAIAKDIVNEVRASVEELRGKIGRQPGLAVVLVTVYIHHTICTGYCAHFNASPSPQVGARPDSAKYVEMKEKAAKDASFNSIKVVRPTPNWRGLQASGPFSPSLHSPSSQNLDANVTQKELISIVNDLNSNKTVDGILVQLPLPDHIEQKRVLQAIDVVKDGALWVFPETSIALRSLTYLVPPHARTQWMAFTHTTWVPWHVKVKCCAKHAKASSPSWCVCHKAVLAHQLRLRSLSRPTGKQRALHAVGLH